MALFTAMSSPVPSACRYLATLATVGRKETVKAGQHSAFAGDLAAYIKRVMDDNEMTGRALARLTEGVRARDYWQNILNGKKVLNTNDVQILADRFGMNPFEFVRQARALSNGEEPFVPKVHVGPHPEDIPTSDDPGSYGLAAERKRKPGE